MADDPPHDRADELANQRLAALDADLKAAQARAAPPADRRPEGKAWSMGAEFVGGVLAGAAIGWWLDKWLGTRPWLFIAMMLLGFATGTWNAMRYGRQAASDDDLKTK